MTQLRNPWSFGVEPKIVTYDESHGCPTQAEAELAALTLAEKSVTYRTLDGIARAARAAGTTDAVVEFTFTVHGFDEAARFVALPQLVIRGVNLTHAITVKGTHTHVSSWRVRPTGKLVCTVSLTETKTFPQRKDGSFSYEKIAELLVAEVERRLTRANMDEVRNTNRAGVDALRQDLGLEKYHGVMQVEPSANVTFPVHVTVKIERSMTYARAVELANLLREHGFLK